jgi:hypothetical protein
VAVVEMELIDHHLETQLPPVVDRYWDEAVNLVCPGLMNQSEVAGSGTALAIYYWFAVLVGISTLAAYLALSKPERLGLRVLRAGALTLAAIVTALQLMTLYLEPAATYWIVFAGWILILIGLALTEYQGAISSALWHESAHSQTQPSLQHKLRRESEDAKRPGPKTWRGSTESQIKASFSQRPRPRLGDQGAELQIQPSFENKSRRKPRVEGEGQQIQPSSDDRLQFEARARGLVGVMASRTELPSTWRPGEREEVIALWLFSCRSQLASISLERAATETRIAVEKVRQIAAEWKSLFVFTVPGRSSSQMEFRSIYRANSPERVTKEEVQAGLYRIEHRQSS